MINLYSLSTCTYFQWDKSYWVFSVVQRKFKIDSPAGFIQRILTMPKLFFFSLSFCVRNSLTVKGTYPNCKTVGPVWATVHWTIIFFSWILLFLGKCPLLLMAQRLQNESRLRVLSKSGLLSPNQKSLIKDQIIQCRPQLYLWTKQNKWALLLLYITHEQILSQCL